VVRPFSGFNTSTTIYMPMPCVPFFNWAFEDRRHGFTPKYLLPASVSPHVYAAPKAHVGPRYLGHANLLVSTFYFLCVSIYSNSRGVFCPHAATQRSIKPLALSQGGPAVSNIRSMASQDRDTSPQQPRTPRRTSVACCRCRGRKVKVRNIYVVGRRIQILLPTSVHH
jgi:hypothetical protein